MIDVPAIFAAAVELIRRDGWLDNKDRPKGDGGAHRKEGDRIRHDIAGAVTLAAAAQATRRVRADGHIPSTDTARQIHREKWEAAHAELHARLGTDEVGVWNDQPSLTLTDIYVALGPRTATA